MARFCEAFFGIFLESATFNGYSHLFSSGFFHRFLSNTNKWIWRILEFRKESLSLGKKILSLGGKFEDCVGIIVFVALKLQTMPDVSI